MQAAITLLLNSSPTTNFPFAAPQTQSKATSVHATTIKNFINKSMSRTRMVTRGLHVWQQYAFPSRTKQLSSLHTPTKIQAIHTDRDRVAPDGSFIPSPTPLANNFKTQQHHLKQPDTLRSPPSTTPYVIGSSTTNGRTAPVAPPVSNEQLDALADFVAESKGGVVVITGAGVSTESNVPDYRGPNGAYSTGFKPMTHQQFMASAENRSRYWARSFAGWYKFSKSKPNAAHEALARLQKLGWVSSVITQNVDRLHHAAGSPSANVLELHGTTHEVVCMNCGALTPREELQMLLEELNPEAAAAAKALVDQESEEEERLRLDRAGTVAPLGNDLRERMVKTTAKDSNTSDAASRMPSISPGGVQIQMENSPKTHNSIDAATPQVKNQNPIQRPDGDVELNTTSDTLSSFKVPCCDSCGHGILKPHVVFFGDSVPKDRAEHALQLTREASHVLAVGTSLAVWSAYRLARAAVFGVETNSRISVPITHESSSSHNHGTSSSREQQQQLRHFESKAVAEARKGKLGIVNVGATRADDLAAVKVSGIAGETLIRLASHPRLLLPPGA